MLENHYVYKKVVDWSLLNQGMSIPLDIQVVLQSSITNFIARGESREINFVLDGNTYKATLINQKFDEVRYPGHKDILQIRYNPQSEIAVNLRSIFFKSYEFIQEQRNYRVGNTKTYIKLPDEKKEFLAVYTTEYPDTYLLECITDTEVLIARDHFIQESEEEYEASINYNVIDPFASVQAVQQMMKIRKLNRAIGDNLKMLYDYKCQICGDNFGGRYGTRIVEAHHIESFVVNQNNDSSNQIIICPNHHRVIHRTEPALDRQKMLFNYTNGIQEKVMINRHL